MYYQQIVHPSKFRSIILAYNEQCLHEDGKHTELRSDKLSLG